MKTLLLNYMKKLPAIFILSLITVISAQAIDPVVTNVTAAQQSSKKLVNVFYDVYDADGDKQYVSIAISTNSGTSFNLGAKNFSGDVGFGITTGANKKIVWDAGKDWNWNYSSNLRFKVTASDFVVPSDMTLVTGSYFQMGDTFGEGYSSELPVHDVYVDDYYIDEIEVSNEKIREVMQWAFDNGKITATVVTVTNLEGDQQELLNINSLYCQLSLSNNNTFVVDDGKTNFPCVEITWFGAQAYCNYKSDMEKLQRCIEFTNWTCNWSNNGYRLPTEAEWEKAARGGVANMRFPWSNTNVITHSVANYFSSDSYNYDVSTTRGYNPAFDSGSEPYTGPVGYFDTNDFGIYDMAGNVWEWNNDWYNSGWYSESDATNANTRGPESGLDRVVRGGSWSREANSARSANRNYSAPDESNYDIGFRCVRLAP